MDKNQARNALLGINLVLGIAFLLFPRLSMRLYGLDPDRDAAAAYPLRYFGGRLLVFAALSMDKEVSGALMKQMPLTAGVDAVGNLSALATGEVPKRVAFLGALTSAVAAAIGFSARE